jgi:hypothetical protein
VFEVLWNKAIPAERRISQIEEGPFIERTEVLYGTDNVTNNELHFFSGAKTKIDTCMDYSRPALAIGIEAIRKSSIEAKRKGVQLGYLTEITNENLNYCKVLMSIVNEVRHLDGIKGNFMATTIFFETKKKLLDRQKTGEHKGIKGITIDESNRKLAKILVDAGIQIKHVRNLPPICFTLSDKQIAVTIEKMEAGGAVQNLLRPRSYISLHTAGPTL